MKDLIPDNRPELEAPKTRTPSDSTLHLPASSATAPPRDKTPSRAGLSEQIGRYRIERFLGKGGFGEIFLARDPELDRLVAIKVPHRHLISKPSDAEQYLTEARLIAGLDHPNIVPVHDVGRGADGLPFVVSKFIEGQDLAAVIRTARVPFTQAAKLVAAVAEALHHAHQRGIIHRDIKPGNILLDAKHQPHVVDFGLALREQDFGKSTAIAGTPAYMSPEQARGEGHRIDGRSDVFSLGIVLYELLTGKRPFRGDVEEVLRQIALDEAQPPRQINDAIPKELERICLKALAKRATERYTTALDLADDLRHYLGRDHAPDRPLVLESPAPEQASLHTLQTMNATMLALADQSIKIVPKGLRSFDEHDRDFFLELLPGPRDREGLPEGIRFWKARVEETDADKTFAVGLLYGPSGCGKSSLVKAGLLPRLSGNVIPVYVEATADETETRLANGLRKHCPGLPPSIGLAEMLTAIRRGLGPPAASKVLIVLDQFEQWLHAHQDPASAELIAALRQCNGQRVQCLVMVRDDFWMAATRFMRELEIPLVEGENSAAVDLFDLRHAKKVLATFGRAFGRLGENPATYTKDEQAFLTQAVAGLAEDGKVISVRLALFAEMMKSKPWSAATLKQVGGTQGVGVTFLEETFSAATAPPVHRLHQRAARQVLQALLPEAGTDIKRNMRSSQELLEASGYAPRSQQFTELIRILDSEIRLITPTDPAGAVADDDVSTERDVGQRYFQLTHDYLVPSLRAWLTRKQKESRRGRTELRLAELAAAWNAKPEVRHLPGWWEWASIRFLTSGKHWTPPQQKMLSVATRLHTARAVILVLALVALGATGLLVRQQVVAESNARYAAALVERLLDAQTSQVPAILPELEKYRTWADPILRQKFAEAEGSSRQRLNASLALLAVDPQQVEFLYQQLLEADPHDLSVLRSALAAHQDVLTPRLWTVVEQPQKGRESQRLRAACALAHYDAESPRWSSAGPPVTQQLVAENPIHLALWIDGFRPVRGKLLPALSSIFHSPADTQAAERTLATNILADYAADQPAVLANLLMEGDDKQFLVLFPSVQKHPDEAGQRLAAELKVELRPTWSDPPLDPAWVRPPPEVVRKLESAGGALTERFAFCQSLPLAEAIPLAENLRSSGYRLTRFRPFAVEKETRAAAVWRRDGQDWRLEQGLAAEAVAARDAAARAAGLHPVDVAAYPVDGKLCYSVLWSEPESAATATVLRVHLEEEQYFAQYTELEQQAFWPIAVAHSHTAEGQRYAGIWSKPSQRPPSAPTESAGSVFVGTEPNYSGENFLADLQVDVCVSRAATTKSTTERYRQLLADAQAAAAALPEDVSPRRQLALAHYYLGQHQLALEDFTWLIGQASSPSAESFRYRAILHARLGYRAEAAADLAKFRSLSKEAVSTFCLAGIVAAILGDESDAHRQLAEAQSAALQQPTRLFELSCSHAQAADAFLSQNQDALAQAHQKQALALLKTAIQSGFRHDDLLLATPELDPLRRLPEFAAILASRRLDRRYAALWHPTAGLASTEIHALDEGQHLVRCQALLAEGFRPVSLSVSLMQSGQPLVAASVWHRPEIAAAQHEALARRKSSAAVALFKLRQPHHLWPLLAHQPNLQVRSHLIRRLSKLAADPAALVERLHAESDHGIRRALALALGDFSDSAFSAEERTAALPALRKLYRDDPDPGTHGAVGWLLRRFGDREAVAKMDDELATGQRHGERKWFVTRQGQTFSIIPGPVEFVMGSARSEQDREGGAANRLEALHKRRIDRTYAISACEITVEQFLRFRKAHEYSEQYAKSQDSPITGVTWFDAAEYCNWLSREEGIPPDQWCYAPNSQNQFGPGMKLLPGYLKKTGYRLASEAEWEYACRAGARTARHHGHSEELLSDYAWYTKDLADRPMLPCGTLKPNDLGLFDMLGNALEWTQDAPLYYAASQGGEAVLDVEQPGPISGDLRVLRGGSANIQAQFVRCAFRFRNLPTLRFFSNGFRIARTLPD